VQDRRAWLVDGVSALLHLVRLSLYLDKNDPESPYEWVFDASKLKDTWDGCTGRLAALNTLKSWSNLDLNVYVKEKSSRDEQCMIKYSTFGERVTKMLHSIEILIDRQVKVASQDGIKISQTINPRKSIVGFDVLDVIKPLGLIGTRIAHFDSWGDGWIDLISSIGVTTIFGNGFGDLIRPEDPNSACCHWKTVPTGMDYMASSVSTIKLLHEKRIRRSEPELGIGEVTSKILWKSPCQPFKSCECLSNNSASIQHHLDPIQFLVSKKSWKSIMVPRGSTLVDIGELEGKGAVVFANLPLLGWKANGKGSGVDVDEKEETSSAGDSSDKQETLSSSVAGSGDRLSTNTTNDTIPSARSLAVGTVHESSSTANTGRKRSVRIGKRLASFTQWARH
jgi:hypothetical protein